MGGEVENGEDLRKKTRSCRSGLMSALGARENLAACGRRFFCLFWLIPALAGIKRGFRHLRMATQDSALRTRKPLKRFDRNFISPAGGTRELFLFRSGKRKRDTIRCLFFLVDSALRTRKPLKRFDRNFISPAGGTRELFLFRSGKRKRDTIRCLFFLVEAALRTRKPLKRFDRNFISPAGGTRELFLFRSGKRKRDTIRCLFFLVEVTGLEPVTLCL